MLTDYLLSLSIKVKLSPSITIRHLGREDNGSTHICQQQMEMSGQPHIPSAHCRCWHSNPSSSNPQPSLNTDCRTLAPALSVYQTIKYWMTEQQRIVNRKGSGQTLPWPHLRYYTSSRLDGLKENTRNFEQYSQCPIVDLNQAPYRYNSYVLEQCFSIAGPWPGTGPWHKLYRATRGSPGICHLGFLSNFHE